MVIGGHNKRQSTGQQSSVPRGKVFNPLQMTDVDGRLAALTASGKGFSTLYRPSEIDTLREFEAVSRNLPSQVPPLSRPNTPSSGQSPGGRDGSGGKVREYEQKVRLLKIQLAEQQMRNATLAEENQDLRGQLTKSQEVLISFAERAREDRLEAEHNGRKRVATSMPSLGGGGGPMGEDK